MTDADGGVATDTATVTVVSRTSSLTLTTRTALRSRATVTAHIGDSVDALSARLLGHVVTYVYDANGNRTSSTRTRTTDLGPQNVVTQQQHDAQNRLTKTTFPDGSTTSRELPNTLTT